MDPNATLEYIRDCIRRYRVLAEAPGDEHAERIHAEEAASAFAELDDWLTRGGFLPADWQAAR